MTFVVVGSFSQFLASFDPDPHVRGKQFEKAVKWLLLNDPKHKRKYKNVWLWDEFPDRTGPDIGIDLVAQGHDNSLCAIQAKCFDPGRDIPKSEIDSFISAASPRKYAHRMLVATTDGLSANARKTLRDNNVEWILRSSLESLESFWPETFSSLGAPRTFSKYAPRTHQTQAINDVSAGLQTASRGQLIMACGTGKTLTALWITERLDASCTLVLVPSLSLLSQTLSEWTTHANNNWEYICVCSDETVNKSDDSIVISVNEIPAVTTKAADIAKFLKTRGRKIVFSTYQSSAQVAKAQKLAGKKFDLTIADEAHRLTGKNDAEFATVLDVKKIPTKKLLFMTATPRTYTPAIKQTASDRGVEISSMDDEKVFGKEFHKLSFGQAIEQDLLTDYRVVIVGVTDPQVQELIERRELVSVGGKVETDARTLAAHIGLAKAVKDYDLKKTISFHGRIKTAEAFAEDFPKIVEWMRDDHKPSGSFWADIITGAMNSSERRILLEKLKADIPNQHSLLSNARCLTEGIDVPALDAVAFIDPRSSQVDIIQAVGRAIRKSTNKTLGTIVLPVLIPSDVDAETAVEDSAFKPIWGIVNALRAHDENLADALDELRTNLGRNKISRLTLPPKLVIDLPIHIDDLHLDFAAKLSLKIVETTTRSWNFWFGLLQAFVKEKGHCQIQDKEIYNGNVLGTWVTKQRMAHTRKNLDSHFVEQLNSIPGWSWAPLDDGWLEMYEALVEYQRKNKSLNIPDTVRGPNGVLAAWTEKQRAKYRRSPKKFENDKRHKLEAIPGWSWDPFEEAWNNMYEALVDYQRTYKTVRMPDNVKGPNGKLRTWITGQRNAYHAKKKTLDNSKIQKLEAIPGWSWDPLEEAWNNMHAALIKYQKENDLDKLTNSATGANRKIYLWVKQQRTSYHAKKKTLDNSKIQKLEAIPGWTWGSVGKPKGDWHVMYEFLVKYQRENNSMKIPDSLQGPSGSLATWTEKQRAKYRRSPKTFEKAKRQKLEAIPGWSWDVREDIWIDMYTALVKYQRMNTSLRVPRNFQGPSGSLATWMEKQRARYRRSPKTFEKTKIQVLEAIPGWTWRSK